MRRRPTAPLEEIKETRNAHVHRDAHGTLQLNQYHILHELGRGAFGTVHLGRDTLLHLNVAIKVFSKNKLRRVVKQAHFNKIGMRGYGRGGFGGVAFRTPTAHRPTLPVAASSSPSAPSTQPEDDAPNPIDLVRGEIAVFKKMAHPNVVRVFEVLDDPGDDHLYMVFELCERGSLMQVDMGRSVTPFSEAEAHNWFTQMLLGIEYIHEHEIAHRDIKPDNLLVSRDGRLKIADFGVSEIFIKGHDRLVKSAGSPAFFSPELTRPYHGDVSSIAADMWAMGVTLYCMLKGRLPFEGESILDLYEAIQTKEPDYSDLSEGVVDLLKQLLIKDPARRIHMDDVRVHPWVDLGPTGDAPPLPTKEENLIGLVTVITDDDMRLAVRNIKTLLVVMKAVHRLKKALHSRRHRDGRLTSGSLGNSLTSTNSAMSVNTDVSGLGSSQDTSLMGSANLSFAQAHGCPQRVGGSGNDPTSPSAHQRHKSNDVCSPTHATGPQPPTSRLRSHSHSHARPPSLMAAILADADADADADAARPGDAGGEQVSAAGSGAVWGSSETAILCDDRPSASAVPASTAAVPPSEVQLAGPGIVRRMPSAVRHETPSPAATAATTSTTSTSGLTAPLTPSTGSTASTTSRSPVSLHVPPAAGGATATDSPSLVGWPLTQVRTASPSLPHGAAAASATSAATAAAATRPPLAVAAPGAMAAGDAADGLRSLSVGPVMVHSAFSEHSIVTASPSYCGSDFPALSPDPNDPSPRTPDG